MKEIEKQVGELLGAKHARFKQIQLQLGGIQMALMNPETSQKLEITDEQRTKVREYVMSSMQDFRSIIEAGDDPEARRKAMDDYRAKQDAKFMEVLTEKQKAKWKELTGPPIKFTVSPMSMLGLGGRRVSNPPLPQ